MTKTYENRLWRYEKEAEVFLEEAEIDNPSLLLVDFDELMMLRYGLDGEEVRRIDAKYLPRIYEVIVSHYPELKDYIQRSLEVTGVDLSIIQKTSV